MDDLYGPPLPPGYVKPEESEDSMSESETKAPKVIGPQRPSFLKSVAESIEDTGSCLDAISNSERTSTTIGPEMPPYLRKSREEQDCNDCDVFGPVPHEFKEDIDDLNDRKAEIEKRAERMKDKLDNKYVPEKTNEREEWMTVPDTSRRNQLGAISRCLAPGQAPSKEKHSRSHRHSEKDKKTSEELKKYNKSRRSESLMDLHAKKLKKKEKEKKSTEKKERKPFDRDEMATKLFTNKQVNSVVDKAKYMNSRFAPGKVEQFL